MAHYDYRCPKCGVFELEQSIKDKPHTKCPKCGSDVKRLISASGVVFKGSGFYVTDHKKDGLHESKHIDKLPEIKKENKPAEKPKGTKSSL
jgi:putative FmdB family regulatory protein